MKIYHLIILLFCFSAFGQIESSKRKVYITAQPEKASKKTAIIPKKTTPITDPKIKFESQFLKKNDSFQTQHLDIPTVGLKEKKVEVKNPSEIYTQKYNQQLKEDGISPELYNRNVDLGKFVVYTQEINLDCRDFSAIDGDIVRIWLNGEVVSNQIYLQSDFKKLTLQLKKGMNFVEIEALNYGESSPNTGQFNFYDANNQLITVQYWGLGIGYKANVNIDYQTDGLKK
jgi:hypothetical protein